MEQFEAVVADGEGVGESCAWLKASARIKLNRMAIRMRWSAISNIAS